MDLRFITILVLLLAAALRSPIFFYLLFVLVGLQLVAWLWLRTVMKSVRWSRTVPVAAFPDELVEVALVVRNESLAPVPWLLLNESVPTALNPSTAVQQVVALGARSERRLAYTIRGSRRGLYRLGPLTLRTGDVLGLYELPLSSEALDNLVIYPRVMPLPDLGLPAGLPFGGRPASGSLFTDPARPLGVRPYAPGDSLRQLDWKSSARVGTLQVRRHEPAIAGETLVALAFSRVEYPGRFTYDSLERAVIAAASIAADLIARGQPVGLCTSGHDPLTKTAAAPIAPNSGRPHLIALLGLLGRLEAPTEASLAVALDIPSRHLGWGATLVVVTNTGERKLIERLLPLQRRGLHIALVLIEGSAEEIALANRHHIPAYLVDRAGIPVAQ